MNTSCLRIGPFDITSTTVHHLVDDLQRRMQRRQTTALFFANTNFVVKCASFASRFRHPLVTLVNDGVGMDLAALVCHGRRFDANLNGTDFVPALLEGCKAPLRVFLYGAQPQVVVTAAQAIEQRWGQPVVGTCSGYHDDTVDVAAQLRAARADLVLVALGNPLQERWVLDHLDDAPGALFVGVGALFDFLSGRAVRAPAWVRRLRLEWLFRMCREPRRLARRYTLDALQFFRICLRST